MIRSLEEYLNLPYTFELVPDELGGWFAKVKELPGCMTQADSADEALKDLQIVQREWLEIALEDGQEIPEPRADEAYSGNFRLRLAKSLHRKLVERAEEEGISLNSLCSTILAEGIGERKYEAARASEKSSETQVSPDWEHLCRVVNVRRREGSSAESTFTGWLQERLYQINGFYQNHDFDSAGKISYHVAETLHEHAEGDSLVGLMAMMLDMMQETAGRQIGGLQPGGYSYEESLRRTIVEVNNLDRERISFPERPNRAVYKFEENLTELTKQISPD